MAINRTAPATPPVATSPAGISKREVVLTFAGVMLAMFLASLDQTIVGTAMPRIVADLGGFEHYTWVTTAYLVASTTVVPIVGRLSDMYGRKWFYTLGIVVFLFGSVLSGLSQTMLQLILFRAVQGVGAGVMMANAFTTIGDLFSPAERGKYQGFMAGIFGLSSVIGPALGGYITDALSWHWVFFINLPLGVVVVGLFIRFFPHLRPAERSHRIDWLGAATLVLAVVPFLLGLSWGGTEYPWRSPQVIGALALAAVALVAFVLIERRAPEPIIPFSLFRNRVVAVSMIVILLTGFGMFGSIIFVPLFFQGVLGVSASSSGSFLTPMMLGMVFGSAVSGQALSRLGGHYRTHGLVGLGLMSAGLFLLSRLTPETSHGQAVASIVLVGLGLGATMPAYTIAVQNAVEHRLMGVATSSTQFFRSIGGTVGLAVLGAFMTSRFSSGLETGVPESTKVLLPPGLLDNLASNPQALVSPQGQGALQSALSQLGPQAEAVSATLYHALRAALATAVADVFLVGLIATLAGLAVTLFLKEVPLRRGPVSRGEGPRAAR